MITLFRWILLKQKKIKLQLTFYTLLEKGINDIDSIIPLLSKLAHTSAMMGQDDEPEKTK